MAMTSIDVLGDPKLLNSVVTEFKQKTWTH
jgi:hypothetical protein